MPPLKLFVDPEIQFMLTENRQRLICVITDYLAVNISWLLFNIVRYHYFSDGVPDTLWRFLSLRSVILGQAFVPPAIVLLFYLSGYYFDVVFRSRLTELINTITTTFIAAVLIYFVVLYNDPVRESGDIFLLIGMLWMLIAVIVYPPRLVLTLAMVKRIHNRLFGYNTLIIGASASAFALADRLHSVSSSMGFNIVGFVNLHPAKPVSHHQLPIYTSDEIADAIKAHGVVRLIVMPHHKGMKSTTQLLNSLFHFGLPIYISPSFIHVVSSRVTFSNIKGEPLVNIARPAFSPMSSSIKRFSDILLSTIALIALLPIFIIVAAAIKIDSRGPIFFRQERIGYRKRPFKIIKFRSMRNDAEENGPALSSADDPRVTRIGRFIRRYRIDELPQFVNVILGQMSLVGPRPERAYYIDQIMKQAPYFSLIHQVRPGITSLGMVKYGYASSVSQMIQRLRYDIIYLENASLGVDLKILFYTIRIVATGRGV